MPRVDRGMEGLIGGACKIRKRGCSSSSSASSIIQNYRFKRAILVGKRGGSKAGTPAPLWRTMIGLRSPSSTSRIENSPRQSHSHSSGKTKQAPVSARKLAATLWEMNEIPSPKVTEGVDERRVKKELRGRDRGPRSVRSGSLPPHLSDPSHSPVSERVDRSRLGSHRGRTSSHAPRLRLNEHNIGVLDSISNASLMEIETRSRVHTPARSTVGGGRTRLKDVSNALTTSKELLKIICRIWGQEDQPSTSMSLVSALHAELERARLQVNQLIQEERSDRNEINYLLKTFSEEKAAWKIKERERVEAAIESIAGELEVEKKLRRRFESLNKKLGRELADTRASFMKVVKELESEKKARDMVEQAYEELAGDLGDDEVEVEVEEKNVAVEKARNELEAFLSIKRGKEKWRDPRGSLSHGTDVEVAAFLNRIQFGGSHRNGETKDDDDGEVDDEEDSGESDLHSIEINMDNNNKSYKWGSASGSGNGPGSTHEPRKGSSTSGKALRRSTSSLQRSMSNGVECVIQNGCNENAGDELDWVRFTERDKKSERNSFGDEMQRYKSVKGLRDQILSGSTIGSSRGFASPTRQWGQPWPSHDPGNARALLQGSGLNPRRSKS